MNNLVRNFPVPESFLVGILLAVVLQRVFPTSLPVGFGLQRAAGLVLVFAGLVLGGWAVSATARTDLARPTFLVRSGPYRYSRNPMYASSTMFVIGLAMLIHSAWMLMAALSAWTYLHFIEIPAEEARLSEKFGPDYDLYLEQVRRWL